MEIILKQDFAGLGYKNDIVKVKPGYGRNYLIPKGFAVVANQANKKVALENVRQAAHKVAKQREEVQMLSEQLDRLTLEIKVETGDNGKIFGSVTSAQLADALKAQGVVVNRKNIRFNQPIKELGMHEATIVLHKDVVYTLSFGVTAA